jgi:hypothetical protein
VISLDEIDKSVKFVLVFLGKTGGALSKERQMLVEQSLGKSISFFVGRVSD